MERLVDEDQLRLALRRARTHRHARQRETAAALDWSAAKLARIESGALPASVGDVRALVAHYELDDEQAAELVELARRVRLARRKPWLEYRDSLSRDFRLFLAYESRSIRMRHFNPLLIPGLLQTEEYARSVLAGAYVVPGPNIDAKLEARLQRQDRLDADDPPRLEVVLDEAVIRRRVGTAAEMRRQLARLVELGARPSISIRVLPFGAGLHPGIGGPFVILDPDEPAASPVLYLETARADATIRHDADAIRPYEVAFARLQRMALSERDSVELIEEVRQELGQSEVPQQVNRLPQ
jgi:uncharacterized protein DUF5753/helix-turn-helix protein